MYRLSAILLAAGGSTRLGRPKQLLLSGQGCLVRRQAQLLLGLTSDVVVVTGAYSPGVAGALKGLKINNVFNGNWAEGMGRSLAMGVRALDHRSHAVLVLLCDQYRVVRADLDALVSTAWANYDDPVAARWGEAFGAPAVLPRSMFNELRSLKGDVGAQALIKSCGDAVRFVDIDRAAFDIDTPEDLMAMQESQLDALIQRAD